VKYHDTESLVVLDDQSNSKKFKSFRDIETALPVVRSYFPIKGEVLIKEGTKSFELEPENPSYKVEWWTEDMWDSQPEGPPKDNDEIFADFFDELFLSPNERILQNYMLPFQEGVDKKTQFIFAKKKYLDSKKKYIFNNIKSLYFYKIGHDYLRIKPELFSLPKSINTKNIELLYFSDGQIIDFENEITPKKFPNLRILIVDTDYNDIKNFPSFNQLEELYIPRRYNNKKTKKIFSFKNLNNLKRIMIRDNDNFNDIELTNLFNLYGKKFEIYNESIQKLLKKRGIKVDLKKNHYSYGTKTDFYHKYIGELRNNIEHGKGQVIFNYKDKKIYSEFPNAGYTGEFQNGKWHGKGVYLEIENHEYYYLGKDFEKKRVKGDRIVAEWIGKWKNGFEIGNYIVNVYYFNPKQKLKFKRVIDVKYNKKGGTPKRRISYWQMRD
jgi:hypothetical protein|tara:strand:+ start:79 stop:1392 length:1314 start_codon:yes stop_codon:yes gene_type:complete